MEIAPMKKVCCLKHKLRYLIKYVHNDLIKDLDLFHIPVAIFNARTSKFDTVVVVPLT